ncbi:hypothetical protein MHSWG343_07960 [Candidatus Mycoplasma haematohominis]|uniref:Uncharacterized protein n=1 Tax=Candidatus Mycoplasma haematohominis TaxID=1494318 RepID=A0A478FTN0_9MOLU|nr:hypothetical protein MHSWG343_07960 [Candidatus Mycoplasma haemohominis]
MKLALTTPTLISSSVASVSTVVAGLSLGGVFTPEKKWEWDQNKADDVGFLNEVLDGMCGVWIKTDGYKRNFSEVKEEDAEQNKKRAQGINEVCFQRKELQEKMKQKPNHSS